LTRWAVQHLERTHAIAIIRCITTRVGGLPLALLMLDETELAGWLAFRDAEIMITLSDDRFVPDPELVWVRLHPEWRQPP
jgi:hypothetical protein